VLRGDLYVPDDGSSDEAVLERGQLRIPLRLDDLDVHQLHVEVLVDAVQGPRHHHVVLELDCNLLPDEGLEEGKEYLFSDCARSERGQ